MKRKVADPQAKAKKQKKIAILGGVLLAALLVIQGPGLLKQLKGAPAEEAPVAAPAPADPSASAPTPEPGGSLASAPVTGASRVPVDPDPAPAAQEGQLIVFNLFKSKDPFVQQLSNETSENGEAGAPPASEPPASSPPASEPPSSTPPVTTPPVTAPPSTTPPVSEPPATEPPATTPPASEPAAAPTTATISINGVSEEVKVGDAFPKANPLFRLVSIKDGVAKIGIAGGSLQDGASTVGLEKGTPLTLMNTADQTRYVLQLLALK